MRPPITPDEGVRFKNREHAARLLAETLARYRGQNPLVLAIPRGAVPMGQMIARSLDGELDVALVHKLGAPGHSELAIGSVDEAGEVYLGPNAEALGVSRDYISRERQRQVNALRDRRALYTPVHPPIDPYGRIVIIVDDGIATGATMVAALHAIRARRPAKLIAAAAVAPPESVQMVRELADEVVCLKTPAVFFAVGQFYEEFPQVSDEEVIAILQQSRSKPGGAAKRQSHSAS